MRRPSTEEEIPVNDTHVTIAGWVGTDVTLTDVAGGRQVASFRMATTPRRRRDGEWHDGPTMWVTVKAWQRLAGHVAASVRQGDPVVVQGRLVADVWEKDDGVVVSQTEVVASAVGHDLTHGTAVFSRAPGRRATEEEAPGATPVEAPVEAPVGTSVDGAVEASVEDAA
jgi:single-strand DNA-binding protein